MIQIQSSDVDPDRVMIQIQSSDVDLDRVMIQIQSSDDDPDQEMIQIRRWRWLEDEDDLKTQKTWDANDEKIQLIQRRRPVLKIVSKEYLPS